MSCIIINIFCKFTLPVSQLLLNRLTLGFFFKLFHIRHYSFCHNLLKNKRKNMGKKLNSDCMKCNQRNHTVTSTYSNYNSLTLLVTPLHSLRLFYKNKTNSKKYDRNTIDMCFFLYIAGRTWDNSYRLINQWRMYRGSWIRIQEA